MSTSLATPTKKAKRDGAAHSTPPVLRKSLSFGSKKRLWRSADEIRPISRSTFIFENLKEDHCEYAVAERNLDFCHKCMQWDQVLEPQNASALECMVLDPLYWVTGRCGVQAPPNGAPCPCSPSIRGRRLFPSEAPNSSGIEGATRRSAGLSVHRKFTLHEVEAKMCREIRAVSASSTSWRCIRCTFAARDAAKDAYATDVATPRDGEPLFQCDFQ